MSIRNTANWGHTQSDRVELWSAPYLHSTPETTAKRPDDLPARNSEIIPICPKNMSSNTVNPKPVYDKAYFIAKFEAIPDELWLTGDFTDGTRCCALGHCRSTQGYAVMEESLALCQLTKRLGVSGDIAYINDGRDPAYRQSSPKARILAALHDLPN